METTEKSVDHAALNETIHEWMYHGSTLGPLTAPSYTSDLGFLPTVQDRCDELDWRLRYRMAAPSVSERYTAAVSPPREGGERWIAREVSDTLLLAICLAIEAAIEKLKPERELHITHGYAGYVQCKRSGMDGPNTILARGVRDDCGGDGVQFCCGRSVHITDVRQLRTIARWVKCQADHIQSDELREEQDKRTQ